MQCVHKVCCLRGACLAPKWFRRFARDNREASAWLSELLKAADASSRPIMLGFDSETPVVWVKKPDGTFTTRQEQVALLQLCYHKPNQVWVSTACSSGVCCSSTRSVACITNVACCLVKGQGSRGKQADCAA